MGHEEIFEGLLSLFGEVPEDSESVSNRSIFETTGLFRTIVTL